MGPVVASRLDGTVNCSEGQASYNGFDKLIVSQARREAELWRD